MSDSTTNLSENFPARSVKRRLRSIVKKRSTPQKQKPFPGGWLMCKKLAKVCKKTCTNLRIEWRLSSNRVNVCVSSGRTKPGLNDNRNRCLCKLLCDFLLGYNYTYLRDKFMLSTAVSSLTDINLCLYCLVDVPLESKAEFYCVEWSQNLAV